MIVVTGCAGFIGSRLVERLNSLGYDNLILVDDFYNGKNAKKIFNAKFLDVINSDELYEIISKYHHEIKCIFHQGAISSTSEWNGDLLLSKNHKFSKILMEMAFKFNIKMIFASSAAVYGNTDNFLEDNACVKPENFYAFSKLLTENFFYRNIQPHNNVYCLRYFNVYGRGEEHKGNMASPIHTFTQQCCNELEIRVFGDIEGHPKSSHKRDFVFIDDVINVNIWMLEHNPPSGVYNCGTGQAISFLETAQIISQKFKDKFDFKVKISEIEFPKSILSGYQFFTQADTTKLRSAGYVKEFTCLSDGVSKYIDEISHQVCLP